MQSRNSPWPRAPDCQSVKHCHPALTHFMGHFCLEGNELVVKMLLQALWTSRRVGLSCVCAQREALRAAVLGGACAAGEGHSLPPGTVMGGVQWCLGYSNHVFPPPGLQLPGSPRGIADLSGISALPGTFSDRKQQWLYPNNGTFSLEGVLM